MCCIALQNTLRWSFIRCIVAGLSMDQSDVCVLVFGFPPPETSYVKIRLITTICDKGSWCLPNKGDRTCNELSCCSEKVGSGGMLLLSERRVQRG